MQTPEKALKLLKEGNQRFLNNNQINRDLLEQVRQTASGQHPFAVVLGCIDSRVPPELIFDQGIGDIFNVRIAGNIANDDILGSLEFACKVMDSVLIVVLGHSRCGAVRGACDDVKLGNLTTLISKLKPAVDSVKNEKGAGKSDGKAPPPGGVGGAFVQKVAVRNVSMTINAIKEGSPILAEMIGNAEIGIVGGMYDVETGKVEFFEND